MDINEKIFEELVIIRKMLTILSKESLEEFNKKIERDHLTTKQRQKMYDLFDGTKSLKEISESVNTSAEAVRLFAVSLEKAGLLDYVVNSKTRCPKRIF